MSHQDVRKVLWSFMGNEFFKRKLNKGARSAESISAEKPNYSTLPNSLVQRMMQEPEAEREADRLSQNITSQTPNDVMREMGSRMGADFSDIRFHTDSASDIICAKSFFFSYFSYCFMHNGLLSIMYVKTYIFYFDYIF